MNDSFGGGFNNTQNDGVKSEKKSEGVLSLFVSQIMKSEDDGIKMWTKSYGFVTLVGIVRKIEHSSTKITYTLEDHTGQIDTHLWIDDGEALSAPSLRLNNYARLYGSVRRQGDTKVLMVYKINPIDSIKELTTHYLEVLHCRYKSESLYKQSDEAAEGTNFKLHNAGNNTITNNIGLSGKHLLVYQAIKTYNKPDGISRSVLQSKFAHISPQELQSVMDFLFQEGHVFTSVDPDHFLSTDNE